jgi:integrase
MTDLETPGAGPETITSLTIIEPATGLPVPAMIAVAGERASLRFIDFFTAHIRNPNTRAAYGVAVRGFFTWLETQGLAELAEIRTHHVSTYTEILTRNYSAPTVKQHLAAIRRLFDWLIVGQVIDQNPAAPVRGPTHVVKKGKTPVLLADEARQLLDSIDVSPIIGLRDRALIALLVYSFARISAALQMDVEDYYLLSAWQALVGSPARKRRQAARDAGASFARGISRRLCKGRRPWRRKEYAAVPHARRPRPPAAHRRPYGAPRRAAHDRPSRQECRPSHSA